MSEAKEKFVPLNVRLKPVNNSNVAQSVNYSGVGVA